MVILPLDIMSKCWRFTAFCCLVPCVCLSYNLQGAAGWLSHYSARSTGRASEAGPWQPCEYRQTAWTRALVARPRAWCGGSYMIYTKGSHHTCDGLLESGQKRGRRYQHSHKWRGSSGASRLKCTMTGAAIMSSCTPRTELAPHSVAPFKS